MASPDLTSARIRSRKRVGHSRIYAPYLLIAPTLLVVFGLLVFPIGYALVLSFSNRMLTGSVAFGWIGLQNYLNLLSPNSEFWHSLWITARFALICVAVEFALGLGLALLLNRSFAGRAWFRTTILIPLVVPALASGLVWSTMYDDQFGVVPYLLRLLGYASPVFLADPDVALYAVAATEIWRASPFMVLVLLAALQAVPQELIEAAQVDGGNKLQVFRYVTLPFIAPVIVVALLFRTVDALRTFDLIYLLTQGGPGIATEVVSMFIYRWGFRHFKVGFTSAASILLFVLTLVVCLIYLRQLVYRQSQVQTIKG